MAGSVGWLLVSVSGGPQSQRVLIPRGETVIIGKRDASAAGRGRIDIDIDDPYLHRAHAYLTWDGETATLRRHERATNPVLVKGRDIFEVQLEPGETFVLGKTQFKIEVDRPSAPSLRQTLREITLSNDLLNEVQGRQAIRHLQTLAQLRNILSRGLDAEELRSRVCEQVLHSVAGAWSVRILERIGPGEWRILTETRQRDLPTATLDIDTELLDNALAAREGRVAEYSAEPRLPGWAIALPVEIPASAPIAMYVIGQSQSASRRLSDELVFVGLVIDVLAGHMAAARAEHLRSKLAQFFSPKVRELLLDARHATILDEPIETKATSMFFDIRGFSAKTEAGRQRRMHFHRELTTVLSFMTKCIFSADGMVQDYQGDGIAACWNVPFPQTDHANLAVACATAMLEKAAKIRIGDPKEPLRCGVGLGCGTVLAGQLGPPEQFKYGILGESVNTASRLESLTKQVNVPVLMNEELAKLIDRDRFLVRRIATFRLAGMNDATPVYELVLPAECGGSGLTLEAVQAYETALAAFESSNFTETLRLLDKVPAVDWPRTFLISKTAQYRLNPPSRFDAIIDVPK
ncbi:MAG TPA: adenylate/guanylate cyclase domain-containing protein [Phycisphaerae bacterium]|jgi:adenylate cyclase